MSIDSDNSRNLRLAQWLRARQLFSQSELDQFVKFCSKNNLDLASQLLAGHKISQQTYRAFQSDLQQLTQPGDSNASAEELIQTIRVNKESAIQKAPGPGLAIGSWKIIEKLGEGGMGVVFTAQHPQYPNTTRVIKVLKSNTASAEERFNREAKAIAKVSTHPNIVSVHTFGRHNNQPYIMMEFVPGQTLGEALKQGRKFSEREATAIILSLASTLDYVHSHDMIHRDLKPANIMLRESGEPMLLDFGLALQFDLETLTLSQQALGTPHYMAPEQITGDRDRIGPGTDIFALGIIYYQLLTGTRPFNADRTQELIAQITAVTPTPPVAQNKSISPAASEICMRALQKQTESRYQSAAQMQSDLQAVLTGTYKSQSSLQSRIIAVILALMSVLITSFFIAMMTRQYSHPIAKTKQRLTAERQFIAQKYNELFQQSKASTTKPIQSHLRDYSLSDDLPKSIKSRVAHDYIVEYLKTHNINSLKFTISRQKSKLAATIDDIIETLDLLNNTEQLSDPPPTLDLIELNQKLVSLNQLELAQLVMATQNAVTGDLIKIDTQPPRTQQQLRYLYLCLEQHSQLLSQCAKRHIKVIAQPKQSVLNPKKQLFLYLRNQANSPKEFFTDYIVSQLPYPHISEISRIVQFFKQHEIFSDSELADLPVLYGTNRSFLSEFSGFQQKFMNINGDTSAETIHRLAQEIQTISRKTVTVNLSLDVFQTEKSGSNPRSIKQSKELKEVLTKSLYSRDFAPPTAIQAFAILKLFNFRLYDADLLGHLTATFPINEIRQLLQLFQVTNDDRVHKQKSQAIFEVTVFWLILIANNSRRLFPRFIRNPANTPFDANYQIDSGRILQMLQDKDFAAHHSQLGFLYIKHCMNIAPQTEASETQLQKQICDILQALSQQQTVISYRSFETLLDLISETKSINFLAQVYARLFFVSSEAKYTKPSQILEKLEVSIQQNVALDSGDPFQFSANTKLKQAREAGLLFILLSLFGVTADDSAPIHKLIYRKSQAILRTAEPTAVDNTQKSLRACVKLLDKYKLYTLLHKLCTTALSHPSFRYDLRYSLAIHQALATLKLAKHPKPIQAVLDQFKLHTKSIEQHDIYMVFSLIDRLIEDIDSQRDPELFIEACQSFAVLSTSLPYFLMESKLADRYIQCLIKTNSKRRLKSLIFLSKSYPTLKTKAQAALAQLK